MAKVGDAEYEFVEMQAAGRALCPFCQVWHNSAGGEPKSGSCPGRYARNRRVGIVVRGTARVRGVGFRVPSQTEINTCLAHAATIRKP